MCAKYELIYHKELNMFNCFCGYSGLYHHCTRKIKGTLNIVSCPEVCKLCEKELDRKEYNASRWKTNEDGYSVCGTCYNKLPGPIRENCFCRVCNASIDEKCACPKQVKKPVVIPLKVVFLVFKHLRGIDLIEVSAACKDWNHVVQTRFISKLKETHKIHTDREWLMKSYRQNFDRFRNDIYWDIINYLFAEKIAVLEREIYDRMFYYVLSFCVWSHLWCCCGSQFDPNI